MSKTWASHTQARRQQEHRRAPVEREQQDVPVARKPVERITEVHIDGLVVLKIIKHCKESFPENVAGSLLGYEKDDGQGNLVGVLEVTHCFPALPPEDDLDDNATYDSRYEVRMVKALKETNVDQSSVGWYSSFYLSSFFTADTVAHQARYQMTVPNAVLLAYDNVKSAQGHLSIRALRLTEAAMAAYRTALADVSRNSKYAGDQDRIDKAVIGHEAFVLLSPSQIFEDVPVKIKNPHLVNALLVDLVDTTGMTVPSTSAAASAAVVTAAGTIGDRAAANEAEPAGAETDFARLDLSTVPYLEKHLEMVNDYMADMAKVQDNAAFVQRRAMRMAREREEWVGRRRRENEERVAAGLQPLPEEDYSLPFFQPPRPDRNQGAKEPLEAHLMSAQITNYCSNITKFAQQNFGKLFLTSQLQSRAAAASSAAPQQQ